MSSDPIRGVQGSKQVLLFDLPHAGFEIHPVRRDLHCGLAAQAGPGDGLRQVFEAYPAIAFATHGDSIFDRILKFPDISRPGMMIENIQDVAIEIKRLLRPSARRICAGSFAPVAQCPQAAPAKEERGSV